jgi:threo-3-hydroxy-L-aspartate ammonia-lyase
VTRPSRPDGEPTIELDDIRLAARRLDGVAHRTPVMTSRTLDGLIDAEVHLKVEAFQRGGAFKFRGAYNAISSLDDDALARGVCTASSGNHAQAMALAASLCGARATSRSSSVRRPSAMAPR